MQVFTSELLGELISSFLAGFLPAWELRGVFAAEALKLIALPFYEFSIGSCLVALGWIAIFWKSKGLLFSGILHLSGLAELLVGFFRRMISWRKI